MYKHLKETKQLLPEGWFFQTGEQLLDDLGLSLFKQSHALNLLEEKGFLTSRNFGRPCKRHFQLNMDRISEILLKGPPLKKESEKDQDKKKQKDSFYMELNAALKSVWDENNYPAGLTISNLNPVTFRALFILDWGLNHYAYGYVKDKLPSITPRQILWDSSLVGIINNRLKTWNYKLDSWRLKEAIIKTITFSTFSPNCSPINPDFLEVEPSYLITFILNTYLGLPERSITDVNNDTLTLEDNPRYFLQLYKT